MAENIAHRLGERRRHGEQAATSSATVLAAALEVERPVFFSMLMIVVAYLPLLSLTQHRRAAVPADGADDGLRPDRGAALRAVRRAGAGDVPVPPRLPANGRTRCCAGSGRSTRRSCACCSRAAGWWSLAVLCVAGRRRVVHVVPRLGIEFLPYMDEGVIWVRANFPGGHVAASRPREFGQQHPRDRRWSSRTSSSSRCRPAATTAAPIRSRPAAWR